MSKADENKMKIEDKIDPKQITFKVNKQSVLIWRRVLLLRYFLKLGDNDDIHVSWSDYDIKNKKVMIQDEKTTFKPTIPASNLAKSITQISVQGRKLVTITLYYTTHNCLVQGQVTQKWVRTEFKLLSEKIQEITKKGGSDVDEQINNIPLSTPFRDTDTETSNSENKSEDDNQTENIQSNENETSHANESNSSIPDEDILEAIHSIENDHIENSLALKNDFQSVQSVCSQILQLTQKLNLRMETIEQKVDKLHENENKIIEKLNDLEEKVNKNVEAPNENMMHDTTGDKQPDCLKFLDTIVELTSKISCLEQKFESIEVVQLNDILKAKSEIDVAKTDSNSDDTPNIHFATKTTEENREMANFQKEHEIQNNLDSLTKSRDNQLEIAVETHNRYDCLQQETAETQTSKCTDLSVTQDKIVNVTDTQTNKKEDECTDLWIIGSSVTKNIQPKLMYKHRTVKITTLQDKTINGAKNYIKSGNVKSKLMILQIGSNDLNKKTSNDVLQEMEDLILVCKQVIPQTKIILSEILPRFQPNFSWREIYETKRQEYNAGLKYVAQKYECNIIKSPFLNNEDVIDGIHPTVESGVPKLVRCYKNVTNGLLNVKRTNQNYNSNYPKYSKSHSYEFTQHVRKTPVQYKTQYDEGNRFDYTSRNKIWNENQDDSWNNRNALSYDYKHGFGDKTRIQSASDETPKQKQLKWVLKSLIEELC